MSSTDVSDLSVAIHTPPFGDYHHWAFCVFPRNWSEPFVFEAIGDRGSLGPGRSSCNPERSKKHLKSIKVGSIDTDDFDRVHHIIDSLPFKNEVPRWNCQSYVFDIIKALENENILGSAPKYIKVKSALKKMRGPMSSTEEAMLNYDFDRLDEGASEEESSESSEGEEEPGEESDEEGSDGEESDGEESDGEDSDGAELDEAELDEEHTDESEESPSSVLSAGRDVDNADDSEEEESSEDDGSSPKEDTSDENSAELSDSPPTKRVKFD